MDQENLELKKEQGETEIPVNTQGEETEKSKASDEEAEEEAEEEATPESLLSKAQKELEEFKSKYYYLAAEMDNLKKRSEKERSNYIKYSNENILRDLIDVQDNFERTVNALRNDPDEKMKNIVFGIDMISNQFMEVLGNYGLRKLDCLGKEFDPNFHEALGKKYVEGKKEMEILEVSMNGFMINDRLLREAKVIVNQKETEEKE